MEKKYKVADFAALVGCTPKTVYKMVERGELNTVNERLNNREITLISTTDEQITELQKMYGKDMVIEGECYEDVTIEGGNEPVKNNDVNLEIVDKIFQMSQMYTEQINVVNNQLITANKDLKSTQDELSDYKGRVLLLTKQEELDKSAVEQWQQECFKKDSELAEKQKELITVQDSKRMVINLSITLNIILILGLITVSLLFAFDKYKTKQVVELTSKQQVIEQLMTDNERLNQNINQLKTVKTGKRK